MSEFWGFCATRAEVGFDRDALVGVLWKLKVKDAVIFHQDRWLHVIVPRLRDLRRLADTVVELFDHESAAWDFAVFVKGKRIGGGTFGTNAETGADDRGFDGELAATAAALGVGAPELEATFVSSSNAFLELFGMTLLPAGPRDIAAGSGIYFTDEENPREAKAPSKPSKSKPKPTKSKLKSKSKAKAKPTKAKPTKSKPTKSKPKSTSKSKSKRAPRPRR